MPPSYPREATGLLQGQAAREGGAGQGGALASGAAHSLAPNGTASAAAQAATDADEALEPGREKGGLADMKRAVAKMVDEPLFVATPKQVTLAQQVGGAGIFNESAGGRAASVTWTAAAYSAAQSLCRSARGLLDAVFGGRTGPRRPAGQRRRAARAGRLPPEPERAVPRARQKHSNGLNDEIARLSKRQAAQHDPRRRPGQEIRVQKVFSCAVSVVGICIVLMASF